MTYLLHVVRKSANQLGDILLNAILLNGILHIVMSGTLASVKSVIMLSIMSDILGSVILVSVITVSVLRVLSDILRSIVSFCSSYIFPSIIQLSVVRPNVILMIVAAL